MVVVNLFCWMCESVFPGAPEAIISPGCFIQFPGINHFDLDDGLDEHLGDLHSLLYGKSFGAQVGHNDLYFSSIAGIDNTGQPMYVLSEIPLLSQIRPT